MNPMRILLTSRAGDVQEPFDAAEVQAQLRVDMPEVVDAAAAFTAAPEPTVRARPAVRRFLRVLAGWSIGSAGNHRGDT